MSAPATTPRLPLRRGRRLFEESQEHVVGGVKRMNLLDDPAWFPTFFRRAEGPYAWDVDGTRYIDLIGGKGSVVLGYADERVDSAVRAAIADSSVTPLTSDLYPRAARLVCECVDSIERVKFFRSGSEAVSAAVRLARVHTGRDTILTCGYHGWHDWLVVERSEDERARVVEFFYDLERLHEVLARRGSEVAAVVVTPEPSLVAPDFVPRAAALAREGGALFVLDEIKSGFRFGTGGYQQHVGVRPDLTTFAKAVANGYALSGIGGRRDVMEAELETRISGTYETENVGLAAALATIAALEALGFERLQRLYERFVRGVDELLADAGIGARCLGTGANAHVVFEDERDAVAFYRSAAAAGVTFYCFDDVHLTYAHEAVLEELLAILRAVAASLSPVAHRLTAAGVHRYLQRRQIASPASDERHALVAHLLR
jgi:glutamate-1-semialdehyde aminotransferase